MSAEQSSWVTQLRRIRSTHRDAVDRASNQLANIADRPRAARHDPTDLHEPVTTYLVPANLDVRARPQRLAADDDPPRTSWLV